MDTTCPYDNTFDAFTAAFFSILPFPYGDQWDTKNSFDRMTQPTTFAELLVARSECFDSITRSYARFTSLPEKSLTKAKVALQYVQTNWSTACQLHCNIVSTASGDDRQHPYIVDKQHATDEEKYIEILNELEDYINAHQPLKTSSPIASNVAANPLAHSNVTFSLPTLTDTSQLFAPHLPVINLPEFKGDYDKWDSFRDYFDSMIVSDTRIDKLRKLHYLKSCLFDEPLAIIDHLSLTEANFDIAWKTLQDHFSNKYRVKDQLFKQLFALDSIQKESATDLRYLHSQITTIIGSLEARGEPTSQWSSLLVYFVVQKLDPVTRKAWSLAASTNIDYPKFDDLKKFILNRAVGLGSLSNAQRSTGSSLISNSNKNQNNNNSRSKPKHLPSTNTHTVDTQQSYKCVLCSENHLLFHCPKFDTMTVAQRFDFVKAKHLCINCFGTHKLTDCRSKRDCNTCHKRHHSKLHRQQNDNTNNPNFQRDKRDLIAQTKPPSSSENNTSDVPKETVTLTITDRQRSPRVSQIILATASVLVHAENGRVVKARALIDPASTWTLVTESLVNSINARKVRASTLVHGVGGVSAGCSNYAASISVSPIMLASPLLHTNAIIMKTLTNYSPRINPCNTSWPHLKNLSLADQDPWGNEPITIIIGADLYGSVLLEGLVKGQPDHPIAQKTIFGWILTGWTSASTLLTPDNALSCCVTLTGVDLALEERLDSIMQRFWEIESVPQEAPVTSDDTFCENYFMQTHSRRKDGRYIVRLPFKINPPLIGDTRQVALRCFLALEKRLEKNPQDYDLYRTTLKDYLDQGHMSLVPQDQPPNSLVSYLPHHGVKKDSTTTKLRVVFNASCLSSNRTSLNDHVYAGPKLQANIMSVLLQWRAFRFVYAADITQMYRQILLSSDERDFQRVLWRENSKQELREYRLNTVTFGVACAPYLALRVLQQLKIDEGSKYPLAIPVLEQGLYVDDFLFGGDTREQAKQTREQVTQLLSRGGFTLRKWASNDPDLLSEIDPANHGLACEKSFQDEGIKLLGICWSPHDDSFQFRTTITVIPKPTKRVVLSTIARIYDPLGWIAPVIVVAKILLQKLWLSKLDWDSALPEDLTAHWTQFYTALAHLNEIRIPRSIQTSPHNLSGQLHAFCDASLQAYATVVFLRSQVSENKFATSLLISKTKVTPTKLPKSCSTPELTIPRLELCGAMLSLELVTYLKSLSTFKDLPVTYWTDATIVLSWLQRPPAKAADFVVRRVNTILKNSQVDQWRHVPSFDNPADLASRGVMADKLIDSQLWFQGPKWLRESEDHWPSFYAPLELSSHACTTQDFDILENLATRNSNFNRIVITIAYILRWSPHSVAKKQNRPLIPDANEINYAQIVVFRLLQTFMFPEELECLRKREPVNKKSALASLNPILDEHGLIRADGRLKKSYALNFDAKHPVILRNHRITRLLVEQKHRQCLHGGLSLTLYRLRQTVWVLQAKKIVRSVIFNCVNCAKIKAELSQQLMGVLPPCRIDPSSRVFQHTGVDYAGPIQIRMQSGRGHHSQDGYIVVFVCFTFKAIHLESAHDCTAQTFVDCLSRFVSRRNLPTDLYSDNAPYFHGSDKLLQKSYLAATSSPALVEFIAKNRIKWHFIPPAAPHFGGLWEAGVKSVKYHLKRVLLDRTPTLPELNTLLCEIESCLNSRPIGPLTDSLDSLEVLTPGHFLVGAPFATLPNPSLLNFSENSLSRWQVYRQILESFWKDWKTDYIQSLLHRSKWRRPQENISVGQIVLMQEPNTPPTKWPLAVVTECFPGDDGLIRTVTVRTATSVYKRPVVKLALLPVRDFITPHLC